MVSGRTEYGCGDDRYLGWGWVLHGGGTCGCGCVDLNKPVGKLDENEKDEIC